MSLQAIEQIARTVLYEGFLLYPYRLSASKNQYRETFGTLYPSQAPSVLDGFERCSFRAESLIEVGAGAWVEARLRFLQPAAGAEAVERQAVVRHDCGRLLEAPATESFTFEGDCRCTIEFQAAQAADGVLRLTARVANESSPAGSVMASAHLILMTDRGAFVSLLDPPDHLRAAVGMCRNEGIWPVLAGEPGSRNAMFCSPIILYDYPRIAPESPGDSFDGTEIDELISLRIRTLTDGEKSEMAAAGPRARSLLERADSLSADEMLRLHGTFRTPQFVTATRPLAPGDHVRLRPTGRADAFDTLLAGMTATIVSVEQDYEGRTHLAVTLDADPGRDLGLDSRPGHRFFFKPQELELLEPAEHRR